MCGIVGILNREGSRVAESVLQEMSACVQHRGPDDDGFFVRAGIGLAHRRLAVIDTSTAGKQPMSTPDGRYTIVYNGEVYNYRELREQYLGDISFRSDSDTEVLLHLLARQGKVALPRLRGMFALALWDEVSKELLLARDPFGKKPLYYAERGKAFVFASEAKAMLAHPDVVSAPDMAAMAKYFLFEYVPSPATGFEGVAQLPMGSYAVVSSKGLHFEKWWQPEFLPKVELSEQEAMAQLDGHMRAAVERRLVADVPVGLLLSGGIDSTVIGWYMKELSAGDVHSYSVSFAQKSYDESEYARKAAQALGTRHHDVRFDVDTFRRVLPEVAALADVPFGDASLLPTYVVSKLAREGITVALDGDGSDELLGGYGTFRAAEVAERLPRMPREGWAVLERLVQLLPTSYDYFSFDFKAKSFLRGLGHSLAVRNQLWLGSFTPAEMERLFSPALTGHISGVLEDVRKVAAGEWEMFDAVSYMTVLHYLHNDILTKLDRATMAVSLEARTPFLDVDLAEFIMRLPVALKRDKYLLRKLMRGKIPDEIIERPKQGFAMPLGVWLRGPLYEWASEVLAPERVAVSGLLRDDVPMQLLEKHRQGKADLRKKLWTLLMFQLWYEKWVGV